MDVQDFNLISPSKFLRGKDAWEKGKGLIPSIAKKPLLLGRSNSTAAIRNQIIKSLRKLDMEVITDNLYYDCCEIDIERIKENISNNKCDAVIATGGGKVLDAGKLLAMQQNIPCITIPLSAATCAGWTALSNIYSPKGAFITDVYLNSCPELFIFDHNFVRLAPKRTIASGIADALAKWYEASITSRGSSDGIVQQALQMARVLRDQLLIDGYTAFKDNKSDAWERVSEGCAITAGLIGGIGGSKCRTAAAHALHNGITQIHSSKNSLHGEIVGFGVLVQLRLEEMATGSKLAGQSISQLLPFLKSLNLPISLEEIGLGKLNSNELEKICEFSCNEKSEIKHLPFNVDPKLLSEAIISTSQEGLKIPTFSKGNGIIH